MVIRGEPGDPMGKRLGLAVFALGILLLAFVFYRGFVELVQAGLLAQTFGPQGQSQAWGNLILSVVARWVLLFLLAYVASAIAGRGIALYQASRFGGNEEG